MSGWARAWIWLLACFIGAVWQPVQAQSVVRYYVTDALGSVVVVTDESGNVMERREYEPYGAQLTPAVQDGPGYTGHVQDAATGLVYMQQRYYDPGIGRFLSVDPVTAYSNPVGAFNRYWYANNNPYKFTDPDGRLPVAVPIGLAARCAANAACRTAVVTAGRKVVRWGGAAIAGAIGAREGMRQANESAEPAEGSGEGQGDGGRIKTPNSGEPGSVYVNPNNGQERLYGEDGLPELDVDYNHDHGQGAPHDHEWTRNADGKPVRGPAQPAPKREEPKPEDKRPEERRDL